MIAILNSIHLDVMAFEGAYKIEFRTLYARPGVNLAGLDTHRIFRDLTRL